MLSLHGALLPDFSEGDHAPMKELTIGRNDAGQRLDRFLAKAVPLLPASLAQKYIRLKRIKCNNARAQRDTRLQEGDVLQLYINDEFFDKPSEANAYLTVTAPKLNIVYEDENILLVDKKPGVAVHPHDGAEYGRTLIDHIQAYLYAKGEWRPREEQAFTPALCNRIAGKVCFIRKINGILILRLENGQIGLVHRYGKAVLPPMDEWRYVFEERAF